MVSGKQAICRELHPPTGVTQCCSAFFTHVAGKGSVAGSVLPNLVIVRATLLQIYTVRASKDDSNESESARLEEVAHYKLAGVVESLAVLRSKAVGVQCDALLLTFRDAKLAVLDWNEESDTIATSSLHYFEGDAALKGGWTVFPYGPRVICDPQGRCAAVTFFRNQLAILPAMDTDDLLLGDGGANAGPAMSTTVGNSYVVSGKKLGFNEVRDSVFLHRYNEPVLLVLYETEPTWPGRYRDKKDTMALVAFSMNVVQKRHARIWSAANLPSDAYKLVPVPLGGVLVLCQNMILYHTQGASCALVVNSNAVPGIAAQKLELIPMVEQPSETAAKHARKYATNVHPETVPAAALHAPRAEGFEIELDAANAAWLSDTTLLLALKTGQLVLVNLHMESSVVCRIQLTKAGAAPPTSSACSLGQGLVMLGSWLGDSLLIRAIPQKEPETPLLTDKPEIKLLTGGKANGGPAAPAAATAAGAAGPSTAATPGTKRRAEDSGRDQHSFAVGSGTPAGPPGIGPDAGNGRELKRRRPNEAGGVTGGSVAGTPANGKVGAGRGAGATPGRPGTVTKQRLEGTDAAGLGDASDTDEEDALVSSIYDVDDPIAMTTTTSTVTHYKLQTLDTLIGLAPIHDMVVGDPLSSAPSEWGQESTRGPQQLVACVGHDRAGCLAVLRRGLIPELITEVPLPGVQGLWAVHYRVPDAMEDANSHTYHAFLLLSAATETKVLETGEELQERNPTEIDFVTDSPTVFAGNVIGAAYIVQVYPLGIRVLRGTDYVEDTPIGDMLPPSDDPAVQASQAQIRLRDACIADPYLLLHLTDGTAAVYTVDLETGELEDVSSANQVLLEQFSEQGSDLRPQGPNFGNRLTRFDCLGEQFPYSGVFVAGPRPVWLIASRGRYVGHAMEVEGQVASMTPFHNVNCPQGFITAAGSGQDERLKICQLPIKVRLDTAWPLQKVALRATPHAIAYYPQAKLYALLVSRQVHYRPRIPEEPGGDEHAAYAYALSDAAAKAKGVERGSEIRLVRSGMFSTLWRHALNPGEDALCIKALQLRNFASGETEPLLAVGTACCLGEDYPCLGRLLFLRVARRAGDGAADLDAGDGEADWEARVVYTREFRGPVVAVDSLEGYLVIAFGARLETHQWMGSTLSMAAFFNAPMLITSLNIIKNFILLGDVHKGAYFIQFTDAFTQLKDISKDFHNADICATEFLINARKLTLLAADAGQNIRLLSYEPGDPRTGVQGKMLLYEGVFHVGHLIAKFLPQPMRITAAAPATQAGPNPKRQAAVYGTLDGSLGVVAPAWDPAAFAVLAALQKALWTDAEHPAGLNPHAFR
ncbi:hypothetical protein WJX72_001813 [[Myrmecia] bisecta]|uniref:Cleavage and polyadenylation specificity factor subunit 1 n=1 Tax=[Myrmecia] bisecta TaxID=41462 RepID=A0AAW1PZU6_9CHLO